jgi:hypothetical protein
MGVLGEHYPDFGAGLVLFFAYDKEEEKMRVTEVTAKYGRKINLGNYSSGDVEATVTASVDEGETPEVILGKAMMMAKDAVKVQVVMMMKAQEQAKQ